MVGRSRAQGIRLACRRLFEKYSKAVQDRSRLGMWTENCLRGYSIFSRDKSMIPQYSGYAIESMSFTNSIMQIYKVRLVNRSKRSKLYD
jgi:hypothetical protein